MKLRLAFAVLVPLVLAAACGSPASDPAAAAHHGGKADSPSELPPPPGDAQAVLDVYALDIWGQALPPSAVLTVDYDGVTMPVETWPLARIPLDHAGTVTLKLVAKHHDVLVVRIGYDGSDALDGAVVNSGDDGVAGVALAHATHDFGRRSLPVHSLYLGAHHKYFSTQGRPARHGNQLELFIDGEHAWQSVATELGKATDTISIATWWFESNFELVRPADGYVDLTADERRQNTILATLERSPATKRVLINQLVTQDGFLSDLTSDSAVRVHGADTSDNFELLGQHNESSGRWWFSPATVRFSDRVAASAYAADGGAYFDDDPELASPLPSRPIDAALPLSIPIDHASMHQKFMVVDQKVAFIGGMNLRATDWDTAAHKVFEPRREPFDVGSDDRRQIEADQKVGKQPPRKDYMMRITGPAVGDADDVFHRRWQKALTDGVDWAWAATDYDVSRSQLPVGGVQAQVTATLPAPFDENAIGETWLNAVQHAEHYIYIEDQYFRAELLNDAILQRMLEKPDLHLIVITKPINEWTDPGCEWTYKSNDLFKDFGDRYLLLQLRSFDYSWDLTSWLKSEKARGYFSDIDVHSKMLIVDDVFLSIGSANKNNRGMLYEGELNLAVTDDKLVHDTRRRILANLVPDVAFADETHAWWQQLLAAAADNDLVYERWQHEHNRHDFGGGLPGDEWLPRGFVYTMSMPASPECTVEGVSPDLM